MPPESAHFIGLFLLKILNSVSLLEIFFPVRKTNFTPREFFGLEFRNTLGVAAGLDKNGDFVNVLDSLGFGFIEIGTTTPEPQKGNPKPRIFRLKKDKALINRLGFNNDGTEIVSRRLLKNRKVLIGGNIGKNKETPNQNASDDYIKSFT